MVWLKSVKFQADAIGLACAKDLTILKHGVPVRGKGESPPVKAGYWGTIPHLESTCTRFNTSARRRTRPSTGPEKSQQLQILPSLNSKAILQRICLLFLLRQHFRRRQRFWMHQVFSIRQRFWMRQVFSIRQRFWMCQYYCIPSVFLDAPMFCIYLTAPTFLYIFLHSYLL